MNSIPNAGDRAANHVSDPASGAPPAPRRLTPSQTGVALLFIVAGSLHFPLERFYSSIIPRALPFKREITYVSGVAEIAGGVGVLLPRTRRAAGKGLIALLVAVFPANINMAVNPDRFDRFPRSALWLRLPLQFACIEWVRRATQR